MGELDGLTAVITGGGSGIGRGAGVELARRGARVVLVSRTRDRLESAAESLRTEGLNVHALVGDISDPALHVQLDGATSRVDILINSAAVYAPYGPVDEVPLDEIDHVLAVDLRAALLLIRHVLPGMKSRKYGRIINIGSVAGRLGAAGQVAYSTAKAALEGLTRSVAAESSRQGITCNMVEPGLVASERALTAITPEVRANLVRATPVGRPGTVEEIVYAVAFLASPRAAFITGAVLPVTGGLGLGA